MSDQDDYRGSRRLEGQAPMVPGHTSRSIRVPATSAELHQLADKVRAFEPPHAPMNVQPAPRPPYEGPETWERVLDALKNVAVIVTCVVLLYTIYRGYVALQAFGDALDGLTRSFGSGL